MTSTVGPGWTESTLVLRQAGDCEALTNLGVFARPWRRISVQIGTFDHATRRAVESRLNRLYTECGCRLGALLTTVALTLVVFERAGGWSPGLGRDVHVLTEITFVVAAAAIGKLLGVTRARRTLNRYAATLSRSAASD